MTRVLAEETRRLETDLNEERSRYQNLLTEHLRLEEKYDDLKEAYSSVRNLDQIKKICSWICNRTRNTYTVNFILQFV